MYRQFLNLLLFISSITACTSQPDAFISFFNESVNTVYVVYDWCYPCDSTSLLTKGTWWRVLNSGKSTRFVADPEAIINFGGYSGGSWKSVLEYWSETGVLSFYVINEECYNLKFRK